MRFHKNLAAPNEISVFIFAIIWSFQELLLVSINQQKRYISVDL